MHQTWIYATFKIAVRPRTPGRVADSFVISLRAVIFSAGLVKHFVLPSKKIGARRKGGKCIVEESRLYDYCESKTWVRYAQQFIKTI